MALGEYVSVSSQRDSERAEIKQEAQELAGSADAELTELTALYEAKGLFRSDRSQPGHRADRPWRPERPSRRRTAHRSH
jgi:VIT1/CCC1 family predicted Fe2+/Mn2+ transporter